MADRGRSKKLTQAQVDEIVRVRVAGNSLRETARLLNLAKRTVAKYAPQWRVYEAWRLAIGDPIVVAGGDAPESFSSSAR